MITYQAKQETSFKKTNGVEMNKEIVFSDVIYTGHSSELEARSILFYFLICMKFLMICITRP